MSVICSRCLCCAHVKYVLVQVYAPSLRPLRSGYEDLGNRKRKTCIDNGERLVCVCETMNLKQHRCGTVLPPAVGPNGHN